MYVFETGNRRKKMTEEEFKNMRDEVRDIKIMLVGVQGDNGLSSKIKTLEKRLEDATRQHVIGYETESSKMWQAIEALQKSFDLYRYKERNETCNWTKAEKDVVSRMDSNKNDILVAIKMLREREQSDKARAVQMTGIIVAACTGLIGALLSFIKGFM